MGDLFSLLLYLAGCFASGKIGEKCGVGPMWHFFIPIYGMVKICECARLSPWWVLAIIVPFVNLGVIVYIYGKVAVRLGKNFWVYGLGSLFFGLTVYMMAFDDSRPVDGPAARPPMAPPPLPPQ